MGTVWIAWADGSDLHTERYLFSGDRQAVREQTVAAALCGLLALTVGENRYGLGELNCLCSNTVYLYSCCGLRPS